MFKKIIYAAVIFVIMTGCGRSKAAFNYSQDIVKKERSLEPDIIATESKVEKFVDSGDYDSIAAAGAHMEEIIEGKIDEISKMPLPDAKGADAFKSAVLRYFNFMKSLYTAYKNWGNAGTEEERQGILGEIEKLVNAKDEAVSDMQAAQKKYADQNGFKLEK